MSSVVRAVTVDSTDACARYDPVEDVTKGYCIDIWHQTVKDLNLEANLTMMKWYEMFSAFRRGEADVLVNKITHGKLDEYNITKYVEIIMIMSSSSY